mmetsp:Transcript_1514/g.3749  ORF Transcript_1514/g.3749 Transcript_1514/m.3749 type:complete len:167 (-) Transcript_1514:61-561(-)
MVQTTNQAKTTLNRRLNETEDFPAICGTGMVDNDVQEELKARNSILDSLKTGLLRCEVLADREDDKVRSILAALDGFVEAKKEGPSPDTEVFPENGYVERPRLRQALSENHARKKKQTSEAIRLVAAAFCSNSRRETLAGNGGLKRPQRDFHQFPISFGSELALLT